GDARWVPSVVGEPSSAHRGVPVADPVDARDARTDDGPVVDVVPLIENQRIGRFWLLLFAVSWAVTFLDGFDLQIISFAGRYIQESFALTNTQLGTLGTVGVVGTLLGGIVLGYLGDRVGR